MVENSQASAPVAKPNIMSIEKDITNVAPEPQVRIEIVEQALQNYKRAGGVIEFMNLRDDAGAVVVLVGAFYCSVCHHLSASTVCQHCASTGKSASIAEPSTGTPAPAVLAPEAGNVQIQ